MLVNAAVASGHKLDRIRRFTGHRAKAINLRRTANLELIFSPGSQPRQFRSKDFEISIGIGFCDRFADLPNGIVAGRILDRGIKRNFSADPLNCHGGGRILLPSEKQRVGCKIGQG